MRATRISAQVPVSPIPFSLRRFPRYCALSRARALPGALDSRFLARSSSFRTQQHGLSHGVCDDFVFLTRNYPKLYQ